MCINAMGFAEKSSQGNAYHRFVHTLILSGLCSCTLGSRPIKHKLSSGFIVLDMTSNELDEKQDFLSSETISLLEQKKLRLLMMLYH